MAFLLLLYLSLPLSSSFDLSALSKSVRLGFNVEALQGNKTVHFRSVHRLLPEHSDVLNPHALTLEERHMERLNEHGSDLVRFGHHLLILRDSNDEELLRFPIIESDQYKISIPDFASILYVACEEPHLILRNKVMQISCGLGLSGLLSTLSVGILQAQQDLPLHRQGLHEALQINSDLFPTKLKTSTAQSLLPRFVQSLTLTDIDEDALRLANQNLHHLVTHTTEAYFSARHFDWRLHPRFNPVKPFFGGILSSNTALDFPSVKELARTVAFYLEPNGRFLHVARKGGPEEESVRFLRKFLHEGYLMSLDERLFTVESQFLKPQILGVDQKPSSSWQVETTVTNKFLALLCAHHAEYDGFNGEYLFPMENGNYDRIKIDPVVR